MMIMHLKSVVYVIILVAILTVLFKMICSVYLIVSAASYDIIIYTINIACIITNYPLGCLIN